MTRLSKCRRPVAGLLAALLALEASAADVKQGATARFTGSQSCASTACHGGGNTHNEAILYGLFDRHARASGILGKSTADRMAKSLGLGQDLVKAVQCAVCHAPMQTVPPDRLLKDIEVEKRVGCESCHGPAEPWLRFHTRPDATFAQMVELGMRNLNDLYGRANACVACHLNIDRALTDAGHPELFFELDAQTVAQPPHYQDARPSLGPSSWLTGQAAALRELSWKLAGLPAGKRDEPLVLRWKALVWLLRKTEPGRQALPEGADFAAMRSAADGLARSAARTTWSDAEVARLLASYTALDAEFRDASAPKDELGRRAEVLAPAIHSLWRARKKAGANESPAVTEALQLLLVRARLGARFEPESFAGALQAVQAAIPKA